jgi:hypothetical protein
MGKGLPKWAGEHEKQEKAHDKAVIDHVVASNQHRDAQGRFASK